MVEVAMNDKDRWKRWADSLRQTMMTNRVSQVSKSVESIAAETSTSKATSTLQRARFWRSCQAGDKSNDSLKVAGFEIEFQSDENDKVMEVTLKLNQTWMSILQGVLDRP